MGESGIVQAVVIVLGVFAVVFLCSLFKSRPRPEAFTGEQLDEIRIRREAAKEASRTTSTTTTPGHIFNIRPCRYSYGSTRYQVVSNFYQLVKTYPRKTRPYSHSSVQHLVGT